MCKFHFLQYSVLFLAVIAIGFSSCSKDDDNNSSGGGADTITMKVDGADWSGPGKIDSSSGVDVVSATNGSSAISFSFISGITTGTFDLSKTAATASYIANGKTYAASSGTLTITSTSPVKGTFNFTAAEFGGGSSTVAITSGSINSVE